MGHRHAASSSMHSAGLSSHQRRRRNVDKLSALQILRKTRELRFNLRNHRPCPRSNCRPRMHEMTCRQSVRMPAAGAIAALVAAAVAVVSPAVQAQAKWDLPTAYPATNFHTENIIQFAATSTRPPTASSRSRCIRMPRCSRRRRSSAPSRAGRRRPARSCWSTSRTSGRCSASTASRSSPTATRVAASSTRRRSRRWRRSSAKQGMMLLYTVPWPPQGIYAKKPLNGVADMKGLKWRAYSPATARIAELVGAQPVTVQAAELTQALATGVVDSYMSSGLHRLRLQDLRAHQVLVRHPGLAAEERGHRQRKPRSRRSTSRRRKRCSRPPPPPRSAAGSCPRRRTAGTSTQLKGKGMTIVKPTDQLKARAAARSASTMLADWQKKAGAEGKAVDRQLSANSICPALRAPPARPALRRRGLARGGVHLRDLRRHDRRVGHAQFGMPTGGSDDIVALVAARRPASSRWRTPSATATSCGSTLLLDALPGAPARQLEIVALAIATAVRRLSGLVRRRTSSTKLGFPRHGQRLIAIPLWIPQSSFVARHAPAARRAASTSW